MKKIILFLSALIVFPLVQAHAFSNEAQILRLKSELVEAQTPKDSIRILFDIWDLSLRKDQIAIGFEIFDIAQRTKNRDIQLDILRQISSVTSNDTIITELIEKTKTVPQSEDQKETLLFLKIKKFSHLARIMDESARQAKITEIISDKNYVSFNKYDQIERMFAICSLLSNHSQGDLLVKYVQDLGKLMEQNEMKSYSLRNLYFTESANIFTATNNEEEAIDADKKILKIIDELTKEYKAKGRKYKNYDTYKYISYRRLLSNYEKLSLTEVNEIYSKILELAAKNEDIKKSFESNYRTKIYHAMKNGRYAEAIPLITKQLAIEENFPHRKHLYEMLITAAKKTGDNATLAFAEKNYKSIKYEAEKAEAQTKYNDLKVRYQVNTLLSNNAHLELERRAEQIQGARKIMTLVIIGWVAFALVLIFMLILWIKNRKTLNQITDFIHILSKERNDLKRKRYGEGSIRGKNSARSLPIMRETKNMESMLNYILNDAMYISSIGQDEEDQFKGELDINTYMHNSYETLVATLAKNVTVDFKYPEENFAIYTDLYCLQWLTNHVLQLAVRLAPDNGTIGLECYRDDKNAYIKFTHSGESLPDGKEELIFKNFISYQSLAKEGDAALKFCRMIHFLLDTKLRSSRETTEGKLILTIPFK